MKPTHNETIKDQRDTTEPKKGWRARGRNWRERGEMAGKRETEKRGRGRGGGLKKKKEQRMMSINE